MNSARFINKPPGFLETMAIIFYQKSFVQRNENKFINLENTTTEGDSANINFP